MLRLDTSCTRTVTSYLPTMFTAEFTFVTFIDSSSLSVVVIFRDPVGTSSFWMTSIIETFPASSMAFSCREVMSLRPLKLSRSVKIRRISRSPATR